MTRSPGRSAAAAMVPAALTVRAFLGQAMDVPHAMNASWMCPLLGFLIYLPFAFAMNQAARLGSSSPWDNICAGLPKPVSCITELIFAVFLLYDAAAMIRLTASSSNIIALKDVTVHLLIVPLCIVVGIVVLLGADAVGNCARIWLRVLALLTGIVFIVQVKNYRPGWIAPVFGSGAVGIVKGGINAAGNMALLSLPWMTAQPDRNNGGCIRYVLFSAVTASILLLFQNMSYPVLTDAVLTHAARIELILTNGRMSLSPQLLLDIIWYGGLIYLIAAETSIAACFLLRCFPGLPVRVLAILEALAVAVAAVWNHGLQQTKTVFAATVFVIIGGVFAVSLAFACLKTRWSEHE